MNYNALALAIKSEIKKRKLIECAVLGRVGITSTTMGSWIKGITPQRETHILGLLSLVKDFELDLKQFADLSSVGGRLMYCRLSKGWVVSEFSEKSQLAISSIHAYEGNKAKPTDRSLFKLSKALGVSVEWILNGDAPLRNGLIDLANFDLPVVEAAEATSAVEEPVECVENQQVGRTAFSIRHLTEQLKDARELAITLGFKDEGINNAAVRIVKDQTGVDLYLLTKPN